MNTSECYRVRLHILTPSVGGAIYDGDTFKKGKYELDFGWGFKWNPGIGIRLHGIDTPEMRPRKAGRTKESIESEKAAAKEARLFLVGLLENAQFIVLESKSKKPFGKYARLLGKIYIGQEEGEWEDVSELMIAAGHAKAYDGGTKSGW
jgi:endonuclease YncB( thermonuclease family)